MPTYVFKNKKTGVVYEDFMSISDMQKIISNPNMELVIESVNIVSVVKAITLMLRLTPVGKKHLLKSQKLIQIVNLQNNMVERKSH